MHEKTVTLTTFDGKDITFTLRNTMRADARFNVWLDRHVKGRPDETQRFNFAWFWARVIKADGFKYAPITEASSEDEFNQAFWAIGDMFTSPDILLGAEAVSEMREPLANSVEKPDDALTPEEEADPN